MTQLDHIGNPDATADVIANLRTQYGDPVPKLELLRAGITRRRYGWAILEWCREIGRIEAERRAWELITEFDAQPN